MVRLRQRALDDLLRLGAHSVRVAGGDAGVHRDDNLAREQRVLLPCCHMAQCRRSAAAHVQQHGMGDSKDAPLRMRRPVPSSVTGTTGTFSLAATVNAPFLNSAMRPVALRVPCRRRERTCQHNALPHWLGLCRGMYLGEEQHRRVVAQQLPARVEALLR